ncbi:hypothetical protein ACDX66_17915 [Peribacillus frigoritolerans]
MLANMAPVWSNAGTGFRDGVDLLIALPFGDYIGNPHDFTFSYLFTM